MSCHERADRRPAGPSGNAPIRPWFLFGGDHPCRPGVRRCDDHPVTMTSAGAPPRPPLARPRDGRMLAGVAAGTAAHLRQDPLIVRVAFVVLATALIGIVAYMLLWLTMPVATEETDQADPGRPLPEPRGLRQWIGLGILGIAAAVFLGQLSQWFSSDVVLPLALVA